MPAVVLPLTEIDRSTSNTPAAEVTGDTVNGHVVNNNDGRVEVIVRNADGAAAHNVTFAYSSGTTVDGTALPGRTVNIPASSTRKFHGFPLATYGASIGITVDSTQLKLSAEHKVGVANA